MLSKTDTPMCAGILVQLPTNNKSKNMLKCLTYKDNYGCSYHKYQLIAIRYLSRALTPLYMQSKYEGSLMNYVLSYRNPLFPYSLSWPESICESLWWLETDFGAGNKKSLGSWVEPLNVTHHATSGPMNKVGSRVGTRDKNPRGAYLSFPSNI